MSMKDDRYRPLAKGDACAQCKRRKVRCSAELPKCNHCSKHGRECVYSRKRYASSPSPKHDGHGSLPTPASSGTGGSTHITPPSGGPAPTEQPQGFLPLDLDSLAPASSMPMPAVPTPAPTTNGTIDWQFTPLMVQSSGMLPMLSSDAGTGQTLPPGFADTDFSWLMDLAKSAPLETAEPTDDEKDHLLWLYFTHQRVFGLEMHVASFYEALQNPDVSKRPHPCLLNAMYLVTCGASPSLRLRSKADYFYNAAKEELQDAIGQTENRLMDAIRCATLLVAWLYNKTRFAEAAVLVGTACKLALCARLHELPSNKFEANPPCTQYPWCPGQRMPTATSQIDLADRVYTFWAVFLVDHCSAISQDHPPLISLSHVSTPLPLTWADYENPPANIGEYDERISDTLRGFHNEEMRQTNLGCIVKAVTLLHESTLVSKLRYSKDANPNKEMLENALQVFISTLPRDWTTVVEVDGRKILARGAAVLHFLIGAVEMFMYDLPAPDPNVHVLGTVRRLLGVMRVVGADDSGDVSIFLVMIWSMMAQILIREGKRLESLGDTFGAALVDADVDFIVSALRARGERLPLANFQAADIVLWKQGLAAWREIPLNR